MDIVKHRYNDLNTMIERIHQQFDDWDKHGSPSPMLDMQTLSLIKLAVHEWLANLVQHADFAGRRPEVSVQLLPEKKRSRCIITDNSEGFDLQANLSLRQALLESYPERGMGLLMLDACTEKLRYYQTEQGNHCLDFYVSANHEPRLDLPF
jgi:serine/threonine-protein kinase RsbW